MNPGIWCKIRNLFAFVLVFSLAAVARAGLGGTTVQYSPQSQGLTLTIPATSSYDLTVTPPSGYAAFPVTVTLRLVPQNIPLGDVATAASYVQFSSPTLTFTAPGQKQVVTVTMTFPATAITADVINPHYTYAIYTDGWAAGFSDGGAAISAGLLVPIVDPNTPNPPQVSISNPADGSQVNVPPGAFPASIPFNFTASTDSISPVIDTISAFLVDAAGQRTPLTFSTTGLGTATVNGSGTLTVPSVGGYSIEVDVANSVGPASDENDFTVVTGVAQPTVAIQTPVSGTEFTYRLGAAPTAVNLTFSGHSSYAVTTLTATLDGQDVTNLYTPTGIGTTDATGSFSLGYTTAGIHTLTVTATDAYGQASTATTYTIKVIAPTPTINITSPTEGQVFTIPYPGTAMNVPFTFVTTSNNGFVVETVSATLNGNPVSVSTTGLNTALANSSGTFLSLVPGSYTFTANGSSAGIPVTQTVHFTVQKPNVPPPSVVINTPAPDASFTKFANGPALTIPMTFTGTSNYTGGVITAVTATLDGVPLVFTPVLGAKVVTNAANMVVSTAGTHTIKVTATDAVGTATATQTFTVVVNPGYVISGSTFFDVDTDGVYESTEFGLSAVAVTLRSQSGQVLATTTSAADGTYAFTGLLPGTYSVSATKPTGLAATNGVTRTGVVTNADVTGVNIGFMIDFCALQGKCANGFTIGYWKNNVDKAISGKSAGTQVSAAAIKTYTTAIGSLALSPYDNITMKSASSIMGSTSSAPKDLLSKQLLASEYNYENKAYINGNGTFTFLFVWWGEYVLKNASTYSSTYIIWAKDWFDAYNNSHGGAICGPSLSGTSCTGGTGQSTGGCGGSYSGGYSSGSSCSSGWSWSCSNSWTSGCGW